MIVFDFADIKKKESEYESNAEQWAKHVRPDDLQIIGSLKQYVIEDHWLDEAKESARIVNARIRVAHKLTEQ